MNVDHDADRSALRWLSVVVLVALALRVGLASFPRLIRWDEPDYLWLGKSFFAGQGYTINGVPELHYTPLFPLLAGAIYMLTGNPELASSFWFVLLGALLPLPIYFVARRMYGERIALLSAALVAVFPGLSSAILYWGTMTEPLFMLLIYGALWAALVALDREVWWRFALVGLLLTLAYLTRPEGLIWLVAFGVLFVFVWGIRRKLWRWRTMLYLAAYIMAYLVVSAPYRLYIHQHTGRWMATGKLAITYDIGQAVLEGDAALYDKVTASLDETTGEILWWSGERFERSMADVLLENPSDALQRIWRNVGRMEAAVFAETIFPLFLLAPMLLGWCRRPWTRHRLEQEAALWFTILPVSAFLPFHVEVRFFSPAFPGLLIWLAAGLARLGEWADETLTAWLSPVGETGTPVSVSRASVDTGRRWPMLVIAVVLLGYLGLAHVRTVQAGMNSLSYAHRVAGLWLKKHTPPDTKVMSRDLAISLYAERGFVVSPRAEYGRYLDYARRRGATYLVVDERELTVLRPHLAFLLDTQNPPPELEPVFAARDRHGRTIVYVIKD